MEEKLVKPVVPELAENHIRRRRNAESKIYETKEMFSDEL